MNLCQYNDCSKRFTKKTHNQKYCSDECCRKATNEKIMARYYERKRINSGAHRTCGYQGCQTVLSRYNYEDNCSVHSRVNYMSDREIEELIG